MGTLNCNPLVPRFVWLQASQCADMSVKEIGCLRIDEIPGPQIWKTSGLYSPSLLMSALGLERHCANSDPPFTSTSEPLANEHLIR